MSGFLSHSFLNQNNNINKSTSGYSVNANTSVNITRSNIDTSKKILKKSKKTFSKKVKIVKNLT